MDLLEVFSQRVKLGRKRKGVSKVCKFLWPQLAALTIGEAIDFTLQEVYGEHSPTAFCAYRSRARRFKCALQGTARALASRLAARSREQLVPHAGGRLIQAITYTDRTTGKVLSQQPATVICQNHGRQVLSVLDYAAGLERGWTCPVCGRVSRWGCKP